MNSFRSIDHKAAVIEAAKLMTAAEIIGDTELSSIGNVSTTLEKVTHVPEL